MLNKIENISTNTDFTHSSAKNAGGIESVYSNSRKLNFNDSFTFSSAFVLLSKIHWKLRKIKIEHNRLVHIEFSADEIIFSTSIDISDQEELCKAIYLLAAQNEDKNSLENLFIEVQFSALNNQSTEEIIPLNFSACHALLQKVIDKTRYSQHEFWQSEIYDELITGIRADLHEELSLIHNQVLIFIEMLTGNSLFPISYLGDRDGRQIQIKNISKLNA